MKESFGRFLTGFFSAVIAIGFIFGLLVVDRTSKSYLAGEKEDFLSAKIEYPLSFDLVVLGKELRIPLDRLNTGAHFVQTHYTLIPASFRLIWQGGAIVGRAIRGEPIFTSADGGNPDLN